MQDVCAELLVSRIFVQRDLPFTAMRVDLGQVSALSDPHQCRRFPDTQVEAWRVERLAALARSLGAEGVLLCGDGSAMSGSALPAAIRCLARRFAGWIALRTRGPYPADLHAVLTNCPLDFVDLQLSWLEPAAETDEPQLRIASSPDRLQSLICRSNCPCIVRFIRPAKGGSFDRVSAAFDAFVRCSHESVAVRMFDVDGSAPRPVPTEGGDLLEFVACRPASALHDPDGDWVQLPRRSTDVVIERRVRLPRTGRRFDRKL